MMTLEKNATELVTPYFETKLQSQEIARIMLKNYEELQSTN